MPELNKENGSRGERLHMVIGSALKVQVDSGYSISVQGSGYEENKTADNNGVAFFENLVEGVHWVSVKPPSTEEDPYPDAMRLGAVVVEPIADRIEMKFRAEIKDLDDQILSIKSKNVQVGGEGFNLTRVGIKTLQYQRSVIRAQLNNHLRNKAGLGPTQWVR